jgi:hypothetical protein
MTDERCSTCGRDAHRPGTGHQGHYYTFPGLAPGTVLRVKSRGGRRARTLTIRVRPGRQFRNTVNSGTEYTTFVGVRVRPADTHVSFGNEHFYTSPTAEIAEVTR